MKFKNLNTLPVTSTNQIMKDAWPPFMVPSQTALNHWQQVRQQFPELQICLCAHDQVVGVVNSLPLQWDGTANSLPEQWDTILVDGLQTRINSANTLSAINLAVSTNYRNQGISKLLINQLKYTAQQLGYRYVLVPLRPSFKMDYPDVPFLEYINAKNDAGMPFDPWIRTHWKLGAKIVKSIPHSFVTSAAIDTWEKWTQQHFNHSGQYHVKGALMPVNIDLANNIGIYSDPNVWMQYDL